MLISCGAALFGLRLAIREIGYLPDVQLLPRDCTRASLDIPSAVPHGSAPASQDDEPPPGWRYPPALNERIREQR